MQKLSSRKDTKPSLPGNGIWATKNIIQKSKDLISIKAAAIMAPLRAATFLPTKTQSLRMALKANAFRTGWGTRVLSLLKRIEIIHSSSTCHFTAFIILSRPKTPTRKSIRARPKALKLKLNTNRSARSEKTKLGKCRTIPCMRA